MNDIPAFPTQIDNYAHYGTQGMTLRDYFAAKALAGYWAHYGADFSPDDADATARHCYQMADAMLKAREAK